MAITGVQSAWRTGGDSFWPRMKEAFSSEIKSDDFYRFTDLEEDYDYGDYIEARDMIKFAQSVKGFATGALTGIVGGAIAGLSGGAGDVASMVTGSVLGGVCGATMGLLWGSSKAGLITRRIPG